MIVIRNYKLYDCRYKLYIHDMLFKIRIYTLSWLILFFVKDVVRIFIFVFLLF